MNNSIIIAVAIVAAAVILKLPIGPSPGGPVAGRYQVAPGQGGWPTRIDTMTGDAWFSQGNRWQPYIDNGARP